MLAVLLVLSVLLSNIPINYRAKDMLAHDYARVILESLEDNAVFFTYADIDTGPIGYMNMIEGVRPDVTVYNGQGLVFSNRLFYPLRITSSEKKSAIHNFLDNIDRPVYFSTTLLMDYGFDDYGLYAKINREIKPPQRKIIVLPDIVDFLENEFSQGEPYDHWENMIYHLFEMEYCRLTASQMLFREDYHPDEFNLDELKNLCKGFSGRTELAELILYTNQPDWNFVRKLLQEAETLNDTVISKEYSVRVYNIWGKYYQLRGEDNKAREVLQQSIDTWPDQKNRAYELLNELQKS